MQKETARMLLQTIADIQGLTFDAQYKLIALEKALKAHDPALYESYQKELEGVRKRPPFEANHQGYSNLHERLARD